MLAIGVFSRGTTVDNRFVKIHVSTPGTGPVPVNFRKKTACTVHTTMKPMAPISGLRGWQKEVLDHLLEQADRKVCFVVVKQRGGRKTQLSQFLKTKGCDEIYTAVSFVQAGLRIRAILWPDPDPENLNVKNRIWILLALTKNQFKHLKKNVHINPIS